MLKRGYLANDVIYVSVAHTKKEIVKYLKKAKIQYGFHYPYAIHQLDALKKSAKYSKNKKRSEEFITSSILENTNKFKIFFLSHGQKLEKIRKRTCLDTRKDLMFIEKVAKYKNLLDVKLDDLIKIK